MSFFKHGHILLLFLFVFLTLARVRTNPIAFLNNRDPSHLVGELPWESGVEPLKTTFAGTFPLRNWTVKEENVEAGMFYWYFPAQKPLVAEPPLIIWLQGGPGSSSMIGLFYEMGPIGVTKQRKLFRRPVTWNTHYSMVFIDQPVGTGYSYISPTYDQTHSYEGYTKSVEEAAEDFMIFLNRFYEKYPEQRQRDLYISGESYAGKYVPAFATAIHQYNSKVNTASEKIKLTGVAIGNGLTHPIVQIQHHADQALQFGIVSVQQSEEIRRLAQEAVKYTQAGNWSAATDTRVQLFDYTKSSAGELNFYDLRTDIQNDWSWMDQLLNEDSVKKALNVYPRKFDLRSQDVRVSMKLDIMKSVQHLIPTLLENYKVLLYQGQFDYRDGIPGNTEWIRSLNWTGQSGFLQAERKVWKVDGHVAGYVTHHDNLTRVEVSRAGHMVPMNAPIPAWEMISKFIENNQFS
ncbi:hypothetical protein K7432_012980 [Basidiobolus ranarum]|uniref:Carboxypeptidase n=1 Tax=Basidiobolus ranarum TaxID=34480 RepID=A0ABR2VRF9_9FUNG